MNKVVRKTSKVVKKTPEEKVVKVKKPISYVSPDDRPEPTEKEVIGINEAEALQKEGWRLISAISIGNDAVGMTIKKYKFIKE